MTTPLRRLLWAFLAGVGLTRGLSGQAASGLLDPLEHVRSRPDYLSADSISGTPAERAAYAAADFTQKGFPFWIAARTVAGRSFVFVRGWSGEGTGFTRNYPILPGQGDEEYKSVIDNDFMPLFDQFAPQVLLTSTGFDAHVDDDMSGINLSTEGFTYIMERLVDTANKHSGGRIISILEGGYSLKRLPELVNNHIELLLKG